MGKNVAGVDCGQILTVGQNHLWLKTKFEFCGCLNSKDLDLSQGTIMVKLVIVPKQDTPTWLIQMQQDVAHFLSKFEYQNELNEEAAEQVKLLLKQTDEAQRQ